MTMFTFTYLDYFQGIPSTILTSLYLKLNLLQSVKTLHSPLKYADKIFIMIFICAEVKKSYIFNWTIFVTPTQLYLL